MKARNLACFHVFCTYVPLSSAETGSFSLREFSFTLEGDVYLRYQSFDSQAALEEGIKKHQPYKIDIGAIFSVRVCS